MNALLESLLLGARPDLNTFIEVFGPALPVLREFKNTPQDPEWHGEGDVAIHTQMVLDELYAEMDLLGKALTPEEQRELILGVVFHDLAKPWTTREMEIRGVMRVAAPRHEPRGRSAMANALVDCGLPWKSLWRVMGMVGSHHEPKLLVVKDRSAGEYRRISRRVDPVQVAWLERADMRGRTCPDKAQQVEHIQMFSMGAEDYAPPGWQDRWRAYYLELLSDRPMSFQDRVFGEAIRALEADKIGMPEDGGYLVYQEPEEPSELVVLCGPSGSGKSSFIERYLSDHEVISMDALREDLAGDRSAQSLNGLVRQEAKRLLKASLRPGRKAVWDATNLRKDFRSIVCGTGFQYGALVTLVVFHMEADTYVKRNAARTHAVPAKVLARQLDQWEWPEVDEAHRMIVVDSEHEVRGAFGICGDKLPWGLRHAG